jgi:hypothetical protein
MEREEVNADEIRDSVNSTGSLSLTSTDGLEQVGAPQSRSKSNPRMRHCQEEGKRVVASRCYFGVIDRFTQCTGQL